MLLHHLTSEAGLRGIVADGVIRTSWPETLSREFPYRVVWLSSDSNPDRRGWKIGRDALRIAARITVEVPDGEVHPWSEWKMRHDPVPVSGLEASARAWGGDPQAWFIVERDIPREEWIEIVDIRPHPEGTPTS